MVSTATQCGRNISCSLLDPGPSHRGWLGFDFVVKESSGLHIIDIQFNRDAAYLAVDSGDDLHDLLDQVKSGRVAWCNSDDRDLTISGDRKDDLYPLNFTAEGQSVRCVFVAQSLESFVYALGLECDRLVAEIRRHKHS